MRVTEKGQITIPKSMRDELGIEAGAEVQFEKVNNTIIVRLVDPEPSRGRRAAARLRGRGDVALTTDEILALTRAE